MLHCPAGKTSLLLAPQLHDGVGRRDQVDETVITGPRAIAGVLRDEAGVDRSAEVASLLVDVVEGEIASISLRPVVGADPHTRLLLISMNVMLHDFGGRLDSTLA